MSLDQLYLLPEATQQAILNGPALVPPAGVTPNLDNPPNRNAISLAVTTVCLSVSTVAFVLAAYAKLGVIKKVHLEDCRDNISTDRLIFSLTASNRYRLVQLCNF